MQQSLAGSFALWWRPTPTHGSVDWLVARARAGIIRAMWLSCARNDGGNLDPFPDPPRASNSVSLAGLTSSATQWMTAHMGMFEVKGQV